MDRQFVKFLALRAAERCLWDVYEKLGRVNAPEAHDLGNEWEKIMRIWWFNVMTPEVQAGLKPGL